ncbi:MAG: hypothetical protein ACLQUY_24865 [Ktedonobacterales bacterium]
MQVLPQALFLVMLELTVGSFVSLYLLDLRGGTTRGFLVFQGVLYFVFGILTLLSMNSFATPEIVRGTGLDGSWLQAQGPLVLVFVLLMIPWNVLLWRSRRPDRKMPDRPRSLLEPRAVAGAITSLTGVLALFVVAMAYRTLADSRLDGAFVVLTFLAGSLALGAVMTAMLLGHWYLNTPTASGKPLEFVTTLLLIALAAEFGFTLLMGPSTAHLASGATTVQAGTTIHTGKNGITVTTPTVAAGSQIAQSVQTAEARQAPLGQGAMVWLQFLMGFIAPLVLGSVALYLTYGRSFQSATGMLYLCVSFIFIGEVLGRGLLLLPVLG